MQANYVQRLRLRLGKDGPARYIGHLDLARSLERAFNRAGVPVAYTQGYNRRPRLQFATALPLGFTSEYELADVWLREEMAPVALAADLIAALPPGLTLFDVHDAPLDEPALQTRTLDSTYTVTARDAPDGAELARRVADLLASEALPRERRGKPYDLRPQILELAVVSPPAGAARLHMKLTLLPAQTGRPDEVAEALGLDPLAVHVHRLHLSLARLPEAAG